MKVSIFQVYSGFASFIVQVLVIVIFAILAIIKFFTLLLTGVDLNELFAGSLFILIVFLVFGSLIYRSPGNVKMIEISDSETLIFWKYIIGREEIDIKTLSQIKRQTWQYNYVFIDNRGKKIRIQPIIGNFGILSGELKKINKDLIID